MIFVAPWMLLGSLLIAVPVVLHLVMRQHPVRVEFPALRFVKARSQSNRRKLQLRHLLLLLLRCLAIALLALALARPSLKSHGSLTGREAPVSVVMVFDTSPRMGYRHENRTRLEQAIEMATRLLEQFPTESEVRLFESGSLDSVSPLDLGTAKQRVGRLKIRSELRSLPECIQAALASSNESKLERRELYLFSDLAAVAWEKEALTPVVSMLDIQSETMIDVVDVGVENPRNRRLGDIELSEQVLAQGGTVHLSTTLVQLGLDEGASENIVELFVTPPHANVDEKPVRRGQNRVKISGNRAGIVEFSLQLDNPGFYQGRLQIVGEDALPEDDTRFFTVEVRPPWSVLIVAAEPVERHAYFVPEALAPTPSRLAGQARVSCEIISYDKLAANVLDSYSAIWMLDPPSISNKTWAHLRSYVTQGGGLGVALGRNAMLDEFNAPAAQQVMPGRIVRQWRATTPVILAPRDYQHPVLSDFRSVQSSVPWNDSPIYRFWETKPATEGSSVLIPYSNGEPGLLERVVGRGRVLLLTTSLSDPLSDPRSWNSLPADWPGFVLLNTMTDYLMGQSDARMNFTAGELAVLHLPTDSTSQLIVLSTPDGNSYRQTVDTTDNILQVTNTEIWGNYRARSGGEGEAAIDIGFSTNIPSRDTALARTTSGELEEIFAQHEFHVVRGLEEIDRSVHLGRVGREITPVLLVFMAIILAGEYILGNRFYRSKPLSDESAQSEVLSEMVHS